MSLKRTFLIAIIFGIAAGAYWWDQQRIEKKTTFEKSQGRLAAPNRDKLTEITMRHGGHETKLAKKGDEWRMSAPVDDGLDKTEIDGLLSAIENATREKSFDVKKDEFKNYGLDPPSTTIDLRAAADNYAETIQLGAKAPSGSDMYARAGDSDKVFTLPTSLT